MFKRAVPMGGPLFVLRLFRTRHRNGQQQRTTATDNSFQSQSSQRFGSSQRTKFVVKNKQQIRCRPLRSSEFSACSVIESCFCLSCAEPRKPPVSECLEGAWGITRQEILRLPSDSALPMRYAVPSIRSYSSQTGMGAMKVQTQAQRAAALLIVAVIIGVGGCAWTPAKRVVDVTIHDDGGKFRFEPAEISVRRGDVVRFTTGRATMPHNVEFVRNSAPDDAELGKTWSGPYLQNRATPTRSP